MRARPMTASPTDAADRAGWSRPERGSQLQQQHAHLGQGSPGQLAQLLQALLTLRGVALVDTGEHLGDETHREQRLAGRRRAGRAPGAAARGWRPARGRHGRAAFSMAMASWSAMVVAANSPARPGVGATRRDVQHAGRRPRTRMATAICETRSRSAPSPRRRSREAVHRCAPRNAAPQLRQARRD